MSVVEKVIARQREVERRLDEEGVRHEEVAKLRKEQTDGAEAAQLSQSLREIAARLEESDLVMKDPNQPAEFVALAAEERLRALEAVAVIEMALAVQLLPPETDEDASEVVLEVRAGTGGSEAQLFAQEVFGMYEQHCVGERGWKFRVVNASEGDAGGFREASAIVTGDGAYRALRLEGGVHRVQRKPLTDRTRVHTSTTTVAVLPSARDVAVDIPEADLVVETTRSRGAGGQHVNTTDSAIRITHVPTGIVVSIQDDRSQHRNRAQAMDIIRAKVFALRKAEADRERSEARRSMIGTGDRSERIRTYNFPQDRVTDHRIGYTVTGVDDMMRGALLADFSERLHLAHVRERLKELA